MHIHQIRGTLLLEWRRTITVDAQTRGKAALLLAAAFSYSSILPIWKHNIVINYPPCPNFICKNEDTNWSRHKTTLFNENATTPFFFLPAGNLKRHKSHCHVSATSVSILGKIQIMKNWTWGKVSVSFLKKKNWYKNGISYKVDVLICIFSFLYWYIF